MLIENRINVFLNLDVLKRPECPRPEPFTVCQYISTSKEFEFEHALEMHYLLLIYYIC